MKTKFKIVAMILLLAGCKKDHVENMCTIPKKNAAIDLSLEDAKRYVVETASDSSIALNKTIIKWYLADKRQTKSGMQWRIPLDGQPVYQNYRQGFREMAISKDPNTGKIIAEIIETIPDAVYLQKEKNMSTATFTGRVFHYNSGYNLKSGQIYSGGKQIGEIAPAIQGQNGSGLPKLKDLNPIKGVQGKAMLLQVVESCVWYQDSYIDGNGELNIHSERICSYDMYDSGGGGGSFGDSGGGTDNSSPGPHTGGGAQPSNEDPSPPPPSDLPGENNNKVDPKKMMECFSQIKDPNAALIVRVYVVEPQPGTSFNVGLNAFGHVAISLSKTSGSTTITQTIGFYPTGTGLEKLDSKSQILDNSYDQYNISATYYVDNDNFQKVINYISNPPTQYHFTDFNCSAFVYAAGQAGNIPIPNPTTQIGISGPGGAGFAKTPAGMASALREQKTKNPNLDINEAGGRIPAGKGPCN